MNTQFKLGAKVRQTYTSNRFAYFVGTSLKLQTWDDFGIRNVQVFIVSSRAAT